MGAHRECALGAGPAAFSVESTYFAGGLCEGLPIKSPSSISSSRIGRRLDRMADPQNPLALNQPVTDRQSRARPASTPGAFLGGELKLAHRGGGAEGDRTHWPPPLGYRGHDGLIEMADGILTPRDR